MDVFEPSTHYQGSTGASPRSFFYGLPYVTLPPLTQSHTWFEQVLPQYVSLAIELVSVLEVGVVVSQLVQIFLHFLGRDRLVRSGVCNGVRFRARSG